ncbi:MAG: hypothetical protein J4G18_13505 [Anaerolineae bacterium]|nr:hypothetical protein [Anaerolineae bacterium]
MLTDDIRLGRIEREYQTVRGTQDQLMDRMNGTGDVLQSLFDQVAANARLIEANRDASQQATEANRKAIEANRKAIETNREEIVLLRQAVAENSQMLIDIMDHLQVPKRRTGFLKTDDSPS